MSRLRSTAVQVGIALLALTVTRLTLYLVYPDDFMGLGLVDVLSAFLGGLRFDFSVLMLCCSLPLVMMHLPPRFANRAAWFKGWSWVVFIGFSIVLLISVGDLIYFDFVRRHIGSELRLLASDTDFLLQASSSYWPAAAGFLAVVFVLSLAWKRALRIHRDELLQPLFVRSVQFVIVLLVVFLGIRGSLSSKSMTVADAFRGDSFAKGTLQLNGAYAAMRTRVREEPVDVSISLDEALTTLALPHSAFPVSSRHDEWRPTGKNIVMILLESWDIRYVDSYRDTPLGLTPNFDRLASEGIRFDNCFSSSQRSIGAVQAMLVGISPMPGVPEIGFGLELSNVTRVGAIARSHGYRTLLVQAPKRRSYYMDSISEALGFELYFGQEDIPTNEVSSGIQPKYGWDNETMQFAMDQMVEFEDPFLAVIITGTTHSPYADPGERFHRAPHALQGENGYINTLAYSDWALGQFMERAREQAWFSDTIFIIGADHPWKGSTPDDLRGSFQIPFILLGSGKTGVDRTVRSQVDVLPTTMELLGFSDSISSLGTGLLAESPGYAIVKRGPILGILASQGQLQHSLHNRLDTWSAEPEANGFDFDDLERKLLSSYRVTRDLLAGNRWQSPVVLGNP